MSLDAELLVDRRRLRRKLTFWRVIAFLVVIFGVIGLLAWGGGAGGPSKRSAHVARLAIDGMILEDRTLLQMIEEIGNNESVEGVIVSINSPGGTTTGGETIYHALRELAEKKPLVAEIRTVGASAGYMIALASDQIFARYNSITGSIGVLFQYGNAAELMKTVGVEMDAVKSSPLKAEPDFYSPTSEEARQVLQTLVDDSYDWFVDLVAERRQLPKLKARQLANGSIYSGHAASENGLIDAIGTEKEAVAWLAGEKGISKDLPVITWERKAKDSNLPFRVKIASAVANVIGNGLVEGLNGAKRLISPAFMLDGLVSVWQAHGAGAEEPRP